MPNDQLMKVEAKLRIQLRANVIKALAHPSRVLIAETLIDGDIVCANSPSWLAQTFRPFPNTFL